MFKKIQISLLFLSLIWGAAAGPGLAETTLGGTVEAEINGRALNFPTLKSDYQATVEGDLATVTVVQTFANPAQEPLNAVYLFPLPTGAAVYEMVMEVGDERIVAQIKRVEEARREYEAAKAEGKAAGLLSQKRPNMFTQEIANLRPGQPVKVTISYVETARRVDGFYELAMPLVVGPRYQPAGAGLEPQGADGGEPRPGADDQELDRPAAPAAPAAEARPAQPDSRKKYGRWEVEALPDYPPVSGLTIPKIIDEDRVSISVKIKAGFPVIGAHSRTHELSLQKINDQELDVALASSRTIDNRDFILRWQLAGENVQAGLLAHKDQRGGFFSLLIEPPAIPAADQITPRELVFVLDTSGSMSGYPLEASKKFMRWALRSLRPDDAFRIITFSSRAQEYSRRPLAATAENLQAAQNYIDRLAAGGGTEAAKAVEQAFIVPPSEGRLRLVVFLTDGYIGNEARVIGDIHKVIGAARIYALGVGTSVNRYLLEEMSRAGRGWCRILDPADQDGDTVQELAAKLNNPVLTDLSIDWGTLEVISHTPRLLPDVFAGQSLRVAGRYKTGGRHEVTVSGSVNGRRVKMPLAVDLPERAAEDGPQAIALVWAREEIAELTRLLNIPEPLRPGGGNNEDLKEKITYLGLGFNLVTQWTAFVAVSEKAPADNLIARDSQVPLPQVAGVSAPAYGQAQAAPAAVTATATRSYSANSGGYSASHSGTSYSGSSTPEPATMSGLALLAAAGWAALRRRKA